MEVVRGKLRIWAQKTEEKLNQGRIGVSVLCVKHSKNLMRL
jgi:hypothetical protein